MEIQQQQFTKKPSNGSAMEQKIQWSFCMLIWDNREWQEGP